MGNDHSADQTSGSSSHKSGKNKSNSKHHHGEVSEDTGASEAEYNLSTASGSSKPLNRQQSRGDIEDSLYQLLGLSNYQIQLLSQSWPRIQQTGGHSVGGTLFRKLSSKNPQCRQAFQKMTIIEGFSPRGGRGVDVYKEHGRLLFDLFNDAIKSLNEPPITVITTCRDYGAKHSTLAAEGFTNIIWDELSEILVEHITKNDAVRKHRELSKAWTALITFLIEKIKDGYKSSLRKPSSHPTSALAIQQQIKHESQSSSANDAKPQLSFEDDQHEGGDGEEEANETSIEDRSQPLTP